MWLSVLIFLVLSGTMLTYQSWAFLAGDKEDTTVPEIVGMAYTDAGIVVEDAGLVLRIRTEGYSDSVVRDDIIEQFPGYGARVKIGREVLVDISLGSRTLTTPNVIGLDRPEAESQLDAIGVTYNYLSPRYSDVAPSGTIINQSPPPGAAIAVGEAVELLTSAGPLTRAEAMPQLEGLSYEEALDLIEEQHLTLRRVSRTYLPGVRDITVSSQFPLPGAQVNQGTEVLLTLSAPSSMQSLGQRSASVSVHVPESVGTVRLRITVQDRYETKEVYSVDHTGPTTIEQLVSGYGRMTVRVYFDNQIIRDETF
jgi:serine/threonine-protein kinase